MSRVRAFLAALAVSAGCLVTVGPPAAADSAPLSTVSDLLDVVTYTVRTVRANADGTQIERRTPALIGVPALVDVDATLVPLPDLAVTVSALPTPTPRVRLDIARLSLVKLPVLVEAVFDLPGGTEGVAFGFDGRSDTAPGTFSTALSFARTPAADVRLDVATNGAGSTLGVIAALFTRGSGGARVDPTEVAVGLTPVPRSLGAHARLDGPSGHTTVELTSSAATRAQLTVVDRKPGSHLITTATVDRLPSSLTLDATGAAAEHRQQLTYRASAPIAAITAGFRHTQGARQTVVDASLRMLPVEFTLTAETPPGGVQSGTWRASGSVESLSATVRQTAAESIASEIVIRGTDLPATMSVRKDGAEVGFTGGSAIGSVEAGLASPGPVVLASEEPAHYLKVIGSSVAARVLGLRSFTATIGDPMTVSAVLASAPLHADLTFGTTHVDAVLDRVPTQLHRLSFSATQGVLEYRASEPIDRIVADVSRDVPLVQRATRARLTVRQIPSELLLDFGTKTPRSAGFSTRRVCEIGEELPDCEPIPGDGEIPPPDEDDDNPTDQFPDESMRQTLLLDANGSSIGSAELLLTSGPDATLPAAQDGVVVEDLADRFVAFARITGLQYAFINLLVDDKRNRPGGRFMTTHHAAEVVLDRERNGGRALVVDYRNQRDRVSAFVTNLPGRMTLDLLDHQRVFLSPLPRLTQARYTASEPIRSVTVDAELPGLPNPVFLEVENVPTLVTLCKASDNRCGKQVRADQGSFALHASAPVRMSAFICFDDTVCTHDNPAAFTDGLRLQDVTLKDLEFELNVGDLSATNPFQARFDTRGNPVTGDLVLLGDGVVDVKFPGPWFIDPGESGGLQISGTWVGGLTARDFQVTFDKQIFEGPLLPVVTGELPIDPATCIRARLGAVSKTLLGGCV